MRKPIVNQCSNDVKGKPDGHKGLASRNIGFAVTKIVLEHGVIGMAFLIAILALIIVLLVVRQL